MPYIHPDRREELDRHIDSLATRLDDAPDAIAGELNYVITKLLLSSFDDVSYSGVNTLVGVLECAKLELYRRLAAPYEDEKVAENGDVY